MTSPILSAVGVEKAFGGVRAVRDVDLSLYSGQVSGLLGPNGAGKSTLVDLLSGQQQPDAGVIILRGREVSGLPAYLFARLGVSRTFQTSRLASNLTVRQALAAVAMSSRHINSWKSVLSRSQRSAIGEVVSGALQRVGMRGSEKVYIRDLGWEQQRRLEIARALAADCHILLLDEPTAGMHSESLPRFSSLIRSIAASGVSVLLIEHNVAFMRETAQELYVMDAGSVIAHGSVDDVLANEQVIASYLGSVSR